MRIAVVQMQITEGEPEENVARAGDLIAAAPAADLYLLPELWTSGYSHAAWPALADGSTPAVLDWMRGIAAERGAEVCGSLISRTEEDRLANRFWIVGPEGNSAWYDKGHLFSPLGEDIHLAPGRSRVRVPMGEWTAALSVCFDLRFPEQYRLDAVDGADLFLVSSSWPYPRCAVLEALSRARAVENQSFLALSNRVGAGDAALQYCGGSVVLAPDGSVLASAGSDECVVVAAIDRAAVVSARTSLPVLPLRAAGLDW